MAKRRVKKTTKRPPQSPSNSTHGSDPKEFPLEKREDTSRDQEVERQIAAIRAIRDVETERLLNALRLLRSNFSKEQLQTPVLQFFEENLPNLVLVRNEKGNEEVQWKENGLADGGGNIHASLLHRMSMAYPVPSFGGFEFSSKTAMKTSFLDTENLQFRDFGLEEPSQMYGLQDGLQTPGGCSSQRMSVGMTPKTLRLPKKGEMLLSVRGSPLGVYNEQEDNINMEAIRESEEG
ncbi:hypothetical protein LguiA_012587 [Lonicera macranthoides]